MNKTQISTRNQVLHPILSFHASHCWALPPSWCNNNPASGSFREALCDVSTWEEHTREQKWEVLGWRGHSRPFLHWQCQLGTVPYNEPYFTVFTVTDGVTITVVSRITTSTVRVLQTVFVPYRITQQAWKWMEFMLHPKECFCSPPPPPNNNGRLATECWPIAHTKVHLSGRWNSCMLVLHAIVLCCAGAQKLLASPLPKPKVQNQMACIVVHTHLHACNTAAQAWNSESNGMHRGAHTSARLQQRCPSLKFRINWHASWCAHTCTLASLGSARTVCIRIYTLLFPSQKTRMYTKQRCPSLKFRIKWHASGIRWLPSLRTMLAW